MIETPQQNLREEVQNKNQDSDQIEDDKLCASAEDITLVKMARHVEKLETQIERMAEKLA